MEINGYKLVMTSSAFPEQYDVFKDDKQVGYLRLRHGSFYVRCPDGDIVFDAEPEGQGEFEDHERAGYLDKAVNAIDEWVNAQENEIMQIEVGSLVKPIDRTNPLVSGCSRYDYAIVVSIDPYIMVSEKADMKWQCEKIEDYKAFGTAPKETIDKCITRL